MTTHPCDTQYEQKKHHQPPLHHQYEHAKKEKANLYINIIHPLTCTRNLTDFRSTCHAHTTQSKPIGPNPANSQLVVMICSDQG